MDKQTAIGAALGLIGGAVAWLFESYRWVGWLMLAAGLAMLVLHWVIPAISSRLRPGRVEPAKRGGIRIGKVYSAENKGPGILIDKGAEVTIEDAKTVRNQGGGVVVAGDDAKKP